MIVFTGIIGAMSTLKQLIFIAAFAFLSACSGGLSVFPSATPLSPTSTPLPPTATPAPMALTVNAEGIALDEFNAELARYQAAQAALGNHPDDQQAAGPVIDEFITQLLLAQGAREAGFLLDSTALQARIDGLAAKLGGADKLSAWQQAHSYSDESFRVVLERDAAAVWMRDKIMSSVPGTAEQVHVRQILLYNQDNAQKVWDRLQAGADFDEIAADVDPVTRGDIGWFARGYLIEKPVETAAFALEPGNYSEIIEDKVGFHIIKLIERQADRPLSPDQTLTLRSRAVEDWLANRRQQSVIVLAPK
jgi:peptidyl-prolyl cis-trans isomerase C